MPYVNGQGNQRVFFIEAPFKNARSFRIYFHVIEWNIVLYWNNTSFILNLTNISGKVYQRFVIAQQTSYRTTDYKEFWLFEHEQTEIYRNVQEIYQQMKHTGPQSKFILSNPVFKII